MEWYENMNSFVEEQMEKCSAWLDAHPGSVYHVVAGVFLLLLIGTIFNWKWAYEPRSRVGWEWYNTFGNWIYRFWRGVVYVIVIIILEILYFKIYWQN